jgi:hypothetical protein
MDGVYLDAFESERAALMASEPIDCSEVHIPLAPSELAAYEPSQVLQVSPPPQDAAMPDSVYQDLFGAENGQ